MSETNTSSDYNAKSTDNSNSTRERRTKRFKRQDAFDRDDIPLDPPAAESTREVRLVEYFDDDEGYEPDLSSQYESSETYSSEEYSDAEDRHESDTSSQDSSSSAITLIEYSYEEPDISLQNNTTERPERIFRPLRKVDYEVLRLQQVTNLLIPRKPFERLVRETAQDMGPNIRFQSAAMKALQEASEIYLVEVFEDTGSCADHMNRVTIKTRDLHLVEKIREKNGLP